MTYTAIACNTETQEIGIAMTTLTINWSRCCPFHHGLLPNWDPKGLIVAPQATVNPHNAHKMFELIDAGKSFPEIESTLSTFDKNWSWRQIGAVTASGEVYGYTGTDAWHHASHIIGDGTIAMGNFMNGSTPVQAMDEALKAHKGESMQERLMRTLEAGRAAGGQADPDSGPVPELFAMLQVFNGKQPWPAVDLRVDFDVHAVPKLRRLLDHTQRMDPVLKVMHENPSATFDEYHVVLEMMNAQI